MSDWFDRYNDAFGACGRGELPLADVLAHYDETLLITTDTLVAGPAAGEAAAVIAAMIEGMQSDDYDHTDIVARDITLLNAQSALFTGTFSRLRRDGSEISRFTVTYLARSAGDGLAINSLSMHPS